MPKNISPQVENVQTEQTNEKQRASSKNPIASSNLTRPVKSNNLTTTLQKSLSPYFSKLSLFLKNKKSLYDRWFEKNYGNQWRAAKQSVIKKLDRVPESAKVFTVLSITAGLGVASLSLASSLYVTNPGQKIASANELCRKYFPAGTITSLSASGLKCVAELNLGDGGGCGTTMYNEGYDVLSGTGQAICTVRTKTDVLPAGTSTNTGSNSCPGGTASLSGVGCVTYQDCTDKYKGNVITNNDRDNSGVFPATCVGANNPTGAPQQQTTAPTQANAGSPANASGDAAVCNSLFPVGVIVGPMIRPEDGRCLAQIAASICNNGTAYRTGGYEIQPNVTPEGNCNVMAPRPGTPQQQTTAPTQANAGSPANAAGDAAVCNSLFPVGVVVGPMIRPEDGRCLAQIAASICNNGTAYRTGGYEIQPNVTPEGNCNVMAPRPGGNTNTGQPSAACPTPPKTIQRGSECLSVEQNYIRDTGYTGPFNNQGHVNCYVVGAPVGKVNNYGYVSKGVSHGCDSAGNVKISCDTVGRYIGVAGFDPGAPSCGGGVCPDGQGNPGNGCVPCGNITGNDGKPMLYGEEVKGCVSYTDCASNPKVSVSGSRCVNKTTAQNPTTNPTNNCTPPKDQFYAKTGECLSRDQVFWRDRGYTGPLSGQGHLNCYIVGAPLGTTDPSGTTTKGKPYGCNADGTPKIACDNVSRYANASVGGFDPGAPSCANTTTGQVTCTPNSVQKGQNVSCKLSGISLPDNSTNNSVSAVIDGQNFGCGVGKSVVGNETKITEYVCDINTSNLNPGSKTPTISGSSGSFTITAPAITSCPSGQYLNGSSCANCPAGNFCTGGTSQPSQCPAGTYCDGGNTQNGGSKPPVTCPNGTTSPAGSTSASQCVSTTTPITKTPLTNDDLKNTNLTCQPANINSTTTCTFTLPGDKTLPNDLKLGIGESTPSGTCSASGENVTCSGVPTGSQAGSQPVYSQIGTTPKSDTGKKVIISDNTPSTKTPLTPEDLKNTNLTCQPANINSTTTCTFTLPGDKTLPNDLKLGIGDANPAGTCTLNGTDNTVTCNSVPTGSQTGSQPIFGQVGANPKVDTTKKVEVSSGVRDITMNDIGNSTDCNSQKEVTIGQTYTCQFPISNGPVRLPSSGLFAKTVDNQDKKGGNSSTCQLQGTSLLVCTQIPTQGLVAGQGKVELGIGNSFSNPTQKGSVKLINSNLPSLPELPNLNPLDFTISVTASPSSVQIGQSIQFIGQTTPAMPNKVCTFTVNTPNGKTGRIQANTDASGRCVVTVNNQGRLASLENENLASIANYLGGIVAQAQTSGASIISGDLVGMSNQTGNGSVSLQIDSKTANANWNVVATNTGATARTGGASILTVFGIITVMGSVMGAAYYTIVRFSPKSFGYKKLNKK